MATTHKTTPDYVEFNESVGGEIRYYHESNGWRYICAQGEGCMLGSLESAQAEVREFLALSHSDSIGIQKWADGQEISRIWTSGEGDARMIGWERADGGRAIETNGDPVFDGQDGFAEAWEKEDRTTETK